MRIKASTIIDTEYFNLYLIVIDTYLVSLGFSESANLKTCQLTVHDGDYRLWLILNVKSLLITPKSLWFTTPKGYNYYNDFQRILTSIKADQNFEQ